MIKYFYKKRHEIPTFFDSRLKCRSTAYGEQVKSEFIDWYNAFYKSWNSKFDNMLICEQGDIGGNAVRADGVNAHIVASDAVEYKTDSALPPLWWNDRIYEVAPNGVVSINKIDIALNIGTELKAWALMTVKTARSSKGALAVIGKPLGSTGQALTVYDLAALGDNAVIDSAEMPATLEDKSFAACFGRHIFTVHDGTLDYFYFNKNCELERCAIGADGDNASFEWCGKALPTVVCDGNADVFWAANGRVYGFTLGAPRGLTEFGCPIGYAVSRIAVSGNMLYIYMTDKRLGSTACYLYRKVDGAYECTLLNDAECNLVLGSGDNFVRYVKITDKAAVTAEYSFADKREKTENRLKIRSGAFCCFGTVAQARYIGYDKRQPVVMPTHT